MFTENLSAFLDVASGHALEALYDGGTTVAVIFDAAYLSQLDDGVSSIDPTALGLASDFPIAAMHKTLAVAGKTYRIRRREPIDDGAFVLLHLERT